MVKTDLFRSSSMGLPTFFAVMFLFNSGTLASPKLPLCEASASVAIAISIDTNHLTKSCRSASALKIIDSRHREHLGQDNIATSCHLPSINTDHGSLAKLTQSKLREMLFFYNGNLTDAGVDAVQIASACSYKHPFWEDKEYPCLIE